MMALIGIKDRFSLTKTVKMIYKMISPHFIYLVILLLSLLIAFSESEFDFISIALKKTEFWIIFFQL